MGKYTCQRPIHPGELLKEEIESRRLPQTQLAAQTGISYKVLNDILNCRRPLTTSTAMLLEAALGVSAGLLMRMQHATIYFIVPNIVYNTCLLKSI